MPINDRLDFFKMWHIQTIGILGSHKKDEFMSFAGQWMKLETIILSKHRNRKPNTTCSYPQVGADNENTWREGGEHHIPGPVIGWWAKGGRALEQTPNVGGAENLDDGLMGAANLHGTCIPM